MSERRPDLRGALVALILLVCGLSLALPQILSHVRLKPALEHYAAWTLLEANANYFVRLVTAYDPQDTGKPIGPRACIEQWNNHGNAWDECEDVRLIAPWNPLRPSDLTLRLVFSNWNELPPPGGRLDFKALVFRAQVPDIGLPVDEYLVVVFKAATCGQRPAASEPQIALFRAFSTQGPVIYRTVREIICTDMHQPNRQPLYFSVASAALRGRGVQAGAEHADRFFSVFSVDLEDGSAIEIGPVKVPAGRALIVATIIFVGLTMSLLVALISAPYRPASSAIVDRLTLISHGAFSLAVTAALVWLCIDVSAGFGIRAVTDQHLSSVLVDALLNRADAAHSSRLPAEVRYLLLAVIFAIGVSVTAALLCFTAAFRAPQPTK
jgi:hypothetical protein